MRSSEHTGNIEPTAMTFVVEGMSCGHCKVAITDELSRISDAESVEVDLDTKLVRVRGAHVDAGDVVSAIEEAGYEAVRA